jgi:hypothetical protein
VVQEAGTVFLCQPDITIAEDLVVELRVDKPCNAPALNQSLAKQYPKAGGSERRRQSLAFSRRAERLLVIIPFEAPCPASYSGGPVTCRK